MKLKSKFIIYTVVVHIAFLFIVLLLLPVNKPMFVAGEVLLVLSLLVSLSMYFAISKPFNLIAAGIESIKDKDFNTRLVKVGHREIDGLILVYNQMIDELREERIKQSEKNHFLDKLIHASPSGIIVLDAEDKIRSINPAASAILAHGSLSLTGMHLSGIPGRLAHELRHLTDGTSEVININGAAIYKCQKAHFVDKGFSHYFIMIEELNDEIYKKEKSAYEKVIRMMSHETNNSIGAINSILTTFIRYKTQLQAEYRDDYENALTVAVNRNTALSKVMSNFAEVLKIPEPVKERTDLHHLLRSVQLLMEAAGKAKQIEWEWQLNRPDNMVYIDVAQMEQVLVNVLKNAMEAVPQKGKIIIRTADNPSSLSILNNGTPISDDISRNLFSPFFSTKKNGQGIGLTVSREILVKHNFKFNLSSYGGWTEFKIVLPE